MKKIKEILKSAIYPHPLFAILFAICAAVVYFMWKTDSFSSKNVLYFSHFLFIYAAVLILARIPYAIRTAKNIKNENIYVKKYLYDISVRVKFGLWVAIIINIPFAAIQLYLGISTKSQWAYILGTYYLVLTIIRIMFVLKTRKKEMGEDLLSEYKCCFNSGVLLCLMVSAVSGIIHHIVVEEKGFEFNLWITISFAAYSFFILTRSIMNLVRYKNHKSPIVIASEWIQLSESMMSVMFLETSILSLLGKELSWRKTVVAVSGGAVCAFVFILSLTIIIGSARSVYKLKKYKNSK